MHNSMDKEQADADIVAELFLFLVLTAGLLFMVIYWK
jgi:hypothetical protein